MRLAMTFAMIDAFHRGGMTHVVVLSIFILLVLRTLRASERFCVIVLGICLCYQIRRVHCQANRNFVPRKVSAFDRAGEGWKNSAAKSRKLMSTRTNKKVSKLMENAPVIRFNLLQGRK